MCTKSTPRDPTRGARHRTAGHTEPGPSDELKINADRVVQLGKAVESLEAQLAAANRKRPGDEWLPLVQADPQRARLDMLGPLRLNKSTPKSYRLLLLLFLLLFLSL